MINKIAIAALGAAVLGVGISRADAQPSATAEDNLEFSILTTLGAGATLTVDSGTSITSSAASFVGGTTTIISSGPAAFTPTPSIFPVGTFASPSLSSTTSVPGSSSPPGSVGVASSSMNNPFVSAGSTLGLGIAATALVEGCCGEATANNALDFGITVTGGSGVTLQFSLMTSGSVVVTTPGATAAGFASIENTFEILDSVGASILTFMPPDINNTCPIEQNICNIMSDAISQSAAVTLGPGNYEIIVDPSAQAAVGVFEPSSMLLLGSGLAGLGFAARRRKLHT